MPIYNTVKDNIPTEPANDPYRSTLERRSVGPRDTADYSSTQNLVSENNQYYNDRNSMYGDHTYEGYSTVPAPAGPEPTYAQVEKKKKIPRSLDDARGLPLSSNNDPYSTYPRNPANQTSYAPRQPTDNSVYGTVNKDRPQIPVEQTEVQPPRHSYKGSTKSRQSVSHNIL